MRNCDVSWSVFQCWEEFPAMIDAMKDEECII